ncbi:MAG: cell envelope integrity protein CreD [Chitinispirillaceae bacterium]|nr:cell envelope integrity protein CreD [Chitinispirillaceae bacterium]
MDSLTLVEKTSNWIKTSIVLKLLGIGILILVLLIPMSMLRSLIAERSALQEQAIDEISSKWGGEQTLSGPVLTIPYSVILRKTSTGDTIRETRYAHFLPEELKIDGTLIPQSRYRGIYKAILYEADLAVSGTYTFPRLDPAQIGAETVHYDRAFLQVGIPDMRGIQRNVTVNWNDDQYTALPGIPTDDITQTGIHVPVILSGIDKTSMIPFSFNLDINGSRRLSFVPVGKKTEVSVQSTWDSPSFDGTFLPQRHSISGKGFTASWQVLDFNRNFPQSWLGSGMNLGAAQCGVSMLTPVAHYQMVTRSVKYAALIIFLTFLLFFMVELMKKYKVHPVQYLLIGTGLVLFYTLLLSLSEQLAFPVAYCAAAGATTLLLSAYSFTIVRNALHVIMVGVLFSILYGFLYIILRSEDYALLIGSSGLFMLLGTVMFLTRNIDWYRLGRDRGPTAENAAGIAFEE